VAGAGGRELDAGETMTMNQLQKISLLLALYNEPCDQDLVVIEMGDAACSFDAAFGLECSREQLDKIEAWRRGGEPISRGY
jgi:hypothetical protein